MHKNCPICQRISHIKENNPYFIKELKTSYVVFYDYQFFDGYTLVISKIHATELH